MEIWKDINGFENLYQVSNMGRVRSKDHTVNCVSRNGSSHTRIVKGKILKPGYVRKSQHQTITLSNGRSFTFPLHRLVAQAFIPNPSNFPCVNHIDENPMNNKIENLEWCSYQYNLNYGNALDKRSKSRSRLVMCIESGEISTVKELSLRLNVHIDSIYNHLRGNTKSLKSLHFRYVY